MYLVLPSPENHGSEEKTADTKQPLVPRQPGGVQGYCADDAFALLMCMNSMAVMIVFCEYAAALCCTRCCDFLLSCWHYCHHNMYIAHSSLRPDDPQCCDPKHSAGGAHSQC